METKTKYIVSSFIGILFLLGFYSVVISENKIVVSFPSELCGTSSLRVTKDDFTLKCGWRIAFQADTIVDYYKTYGIDEWVRNNRYVGFNKEDIKLYLEKIDESSFNIIRETKYRKGKQYVVDGILKEIYTFSKDTIKINYEYETKNSAKHRITMRIKKQYQAELDAFDPFGNTGVRVGNELYYEGYGDLLIDPTVTLKTPSTGSTSYDEGDTIPLVCNSTTGDEVNLTLYWSAGGTWAANGTETVAGDASVTFSREIPHQTAAGTFIWNCQSCNSTGTCAVGATNFTVNPTYKPNTINITSPDDSALEDLNLLNSTGWGMTSLIDYDNGTDGYMWINWSYAGTPDGYNVTYNLSYIGTTTTTRVYDSAFSTLSNSSVSATWYVGDLAVDDYYIQLQACSHYLNNSVSDLCVTDTYTTPIEVFNYVPTITTGEGNIRYSPQASMTKGAALGQTSSKGIVTIDWLGSGVPTGKVNLTLNISSAVDTSCATLYAYTEDNSSAGITMVNHTRTQVFEDASSDPQYIWLWATKASCGTTTLANSYNFEVLE